MLVVMWSFIIIVGFISLNAIYYLFKLIIMTFMDLVSLIFVGKTKYFNYYGYTIRRKRKGSKKTSKIICSGHCIPHLMVFMTTTKKQRKKYKKWYDNSLKLY